MMGFMLFEVVVLFLTLQCFWLIRNTTRINISRWACWPCPIWWCFNWTYFSSFFLHSLLGYNHSILLSWFLEITQDFNLSLIVKYLLLHAQLLLHLDYIIEQLLLLLGLNLFDINFYDHLLLFNFRITLLQTFISHTL